MVAARRTERLIDHATSARQAKTATNISPRPAPTPMNTVPSGTLECCRYGAPFLGGIAAVGIWGIPVSEGSVKDGWSSVLSGRDMEVADEEDFVVDGLSSVVVVPSGGKSIVSVGFLLSSVFVAGGCAVGLGASPVLFGLSPSFGLLSVGAGAGFDAGVFGRALSVFAGGGGWLFGLFPGLLPGAGSFLSSCANVCPVKRARHIKSKHRKSIERGTLPPESLMPGPW